MKSLRWLLKNGNSKAEKHLTNLVDVRVVSKCACGYPSINFSDDWSGGITILADYQFDEPDVGLAGIFAFEYEDKLAGIDVWSIDGVAKPKEVPDPETLRPNEQV